MRASRHRGGGAGRRPQPRRRRDRSSVGFTEFIDVGTRVRTGSPLCLVHAATEADADEAIARLRKAIRIGEPAPPPGPVVLDRIVE